MMTDQEFLDAAALVAFGARLTARLRQEEATSGVDQFMAEKLYITDEQLGELAFDEAAALLLARQAWLPEAVAERQRERTKDEEEQP